MVDRQEVAASPFEFYEGPELEARANLAALTSGYASEKAVRERSKLIDKLIEPLVLKAAAYRESYLAQIKNGDDQSRAAVRKARSELIPRLQEDPEDLSANLQFLGLAAAVFERTVINEKDGSFIRLRPDQLAAALKLKLGLKVVEKYKKDAYENVGVEEPPGEGKTAVAAVAAAMERACGRKVHVVTPSYWHAETHAGQMGRFYQELLAEQVGVAVDKGSKERIIKRVRQEGAVLLQEREGEQKESFVFDPQAPSRDVADPRLRPLKRVTREVAYQTNITIVDETAVHFDYLADSRQWVGGRRVLPDLKQVTAIIDEGDRSLLDEACSPRIYAEKLVGENLWQQAAESLGFKEKITPELARDIFFGIWQAVSLEPLDEDFNRVVIADLNAVLDEILRKKIEAGSLQEGEVPDYLRPINRIEDFFQQATSDEQGVLKAKGKPDYAVCGKQLLLSESFRDKLEIALKPALFNAFFQKLGYTDEDWHKEFENEEQEKENKENIERRVYREIEKWLGEWKKGEELKTTGWGWSIIGQAVQARFVMEEKEEYLVGAEGPVLIDQISGLPLEARQYQDCLPIFLQMKVRWPRWFEEKIRKNQGGETYLFEKLREDHAQEISVSSEVDRLLPLQLCAKLYGRVELLSATLASSSEELAEVLNADILAGKRHLPIDRQQQWRVDTEDYRGATVETEEVDGGPVLFKFYPGKEEKLKDMVTMTQSAKQRPVLCIVETVRQAEEIYERCCQMGLSAKLQLATAATETPAPSAGILVAEGSGVRIWRREEPKMEQVFLNAGQEGMITIATALGSRGLEVNLTEKARAAGGLKLLVDGLMANRRLFLQIIGRALRQDNPGERVVLVSPEDPNNLFLANKAFIFGEKLTKLEKDREKLEKLWQQALVDPKARINLLKELNQAQHQREEQERAARRSLLLRDGSLEDFRQRLREEVALKHRRREEKQLWAQKSWSDFLLALEEAYSTFPFRVQTADLRKRNDLWQAEAEEIFDLVLRKKMTKAS